MIQKRIKNLASEFQTWYGLVDVDSALLLAPTMWSADTMVGATTTVWSVRINFLGLKIHLNQVFGSENLI